VEVKQINQLMVAMGRYGMKKLFFKKDGCEIQLERETRGSERHNESFPEESEENPLHGDFEKRRAQGIVSHETFAKTELPLDSTGKIEDGSVYVDSPMVGTVYLSPNPSDPVFVKTGDVIDEQTVVCLVEAMKVMNEVKAGVKGVVAEVLVESAHPVEYGTRLFRLFPATK